MTGADTIRHLWTHKTQDHPWLRDVCITPGEVDELVGIVADSIQDLQRDIEKGSSP